MLNVGNTIIVNNKRMTCVEITTHEILGNLYKFDNGMELYELELQNNFDLWNSRNGYEII